MNELNTLSLNTVNLNNYRNFYVVAKTLNFTKASSILNISQPAISYSIKKLEEELNCKLFERNGKDIKLTSDGELLNHYVKISYHNLFLGMQKLQGTDDFVDCIIKIGVPTHIGTYLLSKIIDKFVKEYPGVKFKIVSKSTNEMVKMLEYRELDFIVDSYPISFNNENIRVFDLIEFTNCFVGNRKFSLLAKSKNVKIEEFRKYPLLLPDSSTSTMILLNDRLKEKRITLTPKINVSTTEVMLDMVKRGLGIGYFTRMSVLEEILTKKLYEIPVDIQLPTALIQLAYIDDFLSKPAYSFIELVKKETLKLKVKSKKAIRLIYTQSCPYQCFFCHHEGIREERDCKLNQDDLIFLFKAINKHIGINEIHISGGEPLTDNKIGSLLHALYKNNSLISLTTNGYYIDKQIDIFQYINKVNISIHVFDEIEYEKISGIKGSFNKMVSNVKLLRDNYPILKIGINMTIIKGVNDNIEIIKRLIAFSRSIKASLKLIELFNDPIKNVKIDEFIPILENQGYNYKRKTFRKKVFEKDGHEILLTKCTCDAVKDYNGKNACAENNDLYLTMDGLINLCRFADKTVSLHDEIKNRNEEELLNKIDYACDKLGEGCLCQKK